jgi:hypothetical protein
MLWKCLEECHQAPDPFNHLQGCLAKFRAGNIATDAEMAELEETGFKILWLIHGEHRGKAR